MNRLVSLLRLVEGIGVYVRRGGGEAVRPYCTGDFEL